MDPSWGLHGKLPDICRVRETIEHLVCHLAFEMDRRDLLA